MQIPLPHLLCKFLFLLCFADAGKTRHHYGGRVLNIAPKDCTSPRYPGIVGTCMISLECQQRSGTVIGACRDGHLFGACCSEAAEFPTASPLELVSAPTSVEVPHPEGNVKPFKIPQGLLDLANFNIASDNREHHVASWPGTGALDLFTTEKIVQSTSIPTTRDPTTTQVPTTKSTTHPSTTTTRAPTTTTRATPTTTTRPTTTTTRTTTTTTTRAPKTTTRAPTTTTHTTTISTTTPVSTTTQLPKVITTKASVEMSSPSGESISTEQAIVSTTKFAYGKLKYSPRPMKRRSTTEKMIWTRPPTTEASYSIFTNSIEEEDEEDEEEENKKHTSKKVTTKKVTLPHPTPPLTPSSGSIETTTIPLVPISQSTEEVATTIVAPITTAQTSVSPSSTHPTAETTKLILLPTQESIQNVETEKTNKNSSATTTQISTTPSSTTSPTTTTEIPPKVTLPVAKNSRRSNEIVEDNDDTESNSDGWDNKLNELVNQVVEGIAEELDKSNIDDVVFKGTSSTTQRTTTAIPPKKKSNKKQPSTKSKLSIKKHKVTTTTPTPKKRTKPSKKRTRPPPENSVEIERDVLDYREVCGVRPLARQGRIVGGNPSIHGNWPWHALVKETVWWGIYSKIKCGGVLIGPRHVLTAGHCQPQQTGTLSVVLGVTDSDNPSSHAVTKGVRRVIRHPMFNPRSYENDIAILELDSPVQFQPNIVPICLPNLKETFAGKKGFVTGMGLLKHDGERPSMLYEVDVPILNNTECVKMFRKSGNIKKPIRPSFICAGYRHGRKDSCGGDSGGPLSVKRNNGQWVLAGTVSHGIKCAEPNQPGVYMRTTWYLPWIEKVLRSAKSDLPKCHGPPPICEFPQARRPPQPRSAGLMETIFRVIRIARRLWKARK